MKNRRIVLGIAACIVAGCGFVYLAADREPFCQGRSLSEWLIAVSKSHEPDITANTTAAIKHMGTQAVPYLVRWRVYQPSVFKRKLLDVLPWEIEDRQWSRSRNADWALCVRGPDAKLAIPELARALHEPGNEMGPYDAAEILGSLDELGKPVLKAALLNTNATIRQRAIHGMFYLGTNANDVIPDLMKTLDDPDPVCMYAAAETLMALETDPDLVLRALTRQLTNSSPNRQEMALTALSELREHATSALSEVTNLLTSRHRFVRTAAADAIKRITSSTNAPKVE